MKATVHHRFGSPEVRVRASSVNPAEWYAVTGRPYIARPAMGLRRPRQTVPGADFAGSVEAVGSTVTDIRPGDEVFGGTSGGALPSTCASARPWWPQVVDYTRDDFTLSGRRYDLLLDVAGSRSWSDCKRVLAQDATLVLVGGPKTNPWTGPLGHVASVRLASLRASQKAVFFVAKFTREDFLLLQELLEAGKVTPVIDRQ